MDGKARQAQAKDDEDAGEDAEETMKIHSIRAQEDTARGLTSNITSEEGVGPRTGGAPFMEASMSPRNSSGQRMLLEFDMDICYRMRCNPTTTSEIFALGPSWGSVEPSEEYYFC